MRNFNMTRINQPSSAQPDQTVLSADERTRLEEWESGFLRLPIHASILHDMRACMDGKQSAAIIGPRGVGKTYSISRLKADLEAEEIARNSTFPRQILSYEASEATGAKTALVDLHEQVIGPISTGMRRQASPKFLIDQIAQECQIKNYALLCIDEAQKISPHNLDLLRQVVDSAKRLGHRMGLVLIGNEGLRGSLVQIQQLGQRIATEIQIPLLSPAHLRAHWVELHPHVPAIKSRLDPKEWRRLEKEVEVKVNGKLRRLAMLLHIANGLALALDRPVDQEIIRYAIQKLADER